MSGMRGKKEGKMREVGGRREGVSEVDSMKGQIHMHCQR